MIIKTNIFVLKGLFLIVKMTTQTYNLSKIKQLIDLNGDSINFDLTFKVSCKDNTKVFKVLVVDQTTLDNSPTLQYKEATGSIKGNVIADKNVFQNYFLVLKSEEPCTVEVEIDKKELPKTPEVDMENLQHENKSKKKKINWFKILLISGIVILGGIILWYLYKCNESKQNDDSKVGFSFDKPIEKPVDKPQINLKPTENPSIAEPKLYSLEGSDISNKSSNNSSSSLNDDNLLQKLQNYDKE